MKRLLTYLRDLFRNLFPLFFPSQLEPNFVYCPYPNGRYQYFGRTNGASRLGKTNRLHMSRNTRNRQRRRNKN